LSCADKIIRTETDQATGEENEHAIPLHERLHRLRSRECYTRALAAAFAENSRPSCSLVSHSDVVVPRPSARMSTPASSIKVR
jgi:hypothetical protein